MAQKVQILLVDDIDGSDASETVAFGLDGAHYEIDLTEEHATQLREALAPYLGHARKVSSGAGRRARAARPSSAASSSSSGGASAKDVRAWARDNGLSVPERGRIPSEVRDAYDNAH